MIEVYLRAVELRLQEKAGAKLVDHWNNQIQFMDETKQVYPAAYVDFGTIQWSNTMSGIKTGRCLMAVHCANKNTRDTDAKANDKDGKRLKRFDWSRAVVNALDNFNAKDLEGNTIIKTMHIDSSQMDTNHDALTDDVIFFSAQLYYYETWREKDWREIVLEAISLERIEADTKPDPGLPPELPPDTSEDYDWDLLRWDEEGGRWVRWHKPAVEGTYAIRRNADGSLEFVATEAGGADWGSIGGNITDQTDLKAALDGKVNTEAGKGLSANDLTNLLKTAYDAAVAWISTNGTNLLNHLTNTSNPHNVTKAQVGLGNVDNTSDANKPVSDATQNALDSEAITRLNADTNLSGDILAEASARASADNSIIDMLASYATQAWVNAQGFLTSASLGVSTDAYNTLTNGADSKPYLRNQYDPVGGNVLSEIIDDFAYVTPLSGAFFASHAMLHSGNSVFSISNTVGSLTNQLSVVECIYNGAGDNVWFIQRAVALGQGEVCIGCYLRRPNDGGAANQSNLRVGLRLGATEGTDGVFFKLNEATNSDKWQCITRASSVSTTSNTSVTTAKGSWVRLFIVINAARTEAKFYINGTLVATNTTNLPASGTALTGIINMERTVISSTITWQIDYFYLKQTFTTPR